MRTGLKREQLNSIVGKRFGSWRVLSYAGKEFNKQRKFFDYLYNCICTNCGEQKVKTRNVLQVLQSHADDISRSNTGKFCDHCTNKGNETILRSDKAPSTSSTGIKHLSFSNATNKFTVSITINYIYYILYNGIFKDQAVQMANGLNAFVSNPANSRESCIKRCEQRAIRIEKRFNKSKFNKGEI